MPGFSHSGGTGTDVSRRRQWRGDDQALGKRRGELRHAGIERLFRRAADDHPVPIPLGDEFLHLADQRVEFATSVVERSFHPAFLDEGEFEVFGNKPSKAIMVRTRRRARADKANFYWHADYRQLARLLRTRPERPRHRAAEQSDELDPVYDRLGSRAALSGHFRRSPILVR